MHSTRRRNRAAVKSISSKWLTQNAVLCAIFTILMVCVKCNECLALKRSAAPDYNLENADTGMDKIHVNYDEYPVCTEMKPLNTNAHRLLPINPNTQAQRWLGDSFKLSSEGIRWFVRATSEPVSIGRLAWSGNTTSSGKINRKSKCGFFAITSEIKRTRRLTVFVLPFSVTPTSIDTILNWFLIFRVEWKRSPHALRPSSWATSSHPH